MSWGSFQPSDVELARDVHPNDAEHRHVSAVVGAQHLHDRFTPLERCDQRRGQPDLLPQKRRQRGRWLLGIERGPARYQHGAPDEPDPRDGASAAVAAHSAPGCAGHRCRHATPHRCPPGKTIGSFQIFADRGCHDACLWECGLSLQQRGPGSLRSAGLHEGWPACCCPTPALPWCPDAERKEISREREAQGTPLLAGVTGESQWGSRGDGNRRVRSPVHGARSPMRPGPRDLYLVCPPRSPGERRLARSGSAAGCQVGGPQSALCATTM